MSHIHWASGNQEHTHSLHVSLKQLKTGFFFYIHYNALNNIESNDQRQDKKTLL